MEKLIEFIEDKITEYQFSSYLAKGIGHYETCRSLDEFVRVLEEIKKQILKGE